MSAFGNLAADLMATLQSAAGVAVIYHRGADSVPITAIPGRSTIETDDGQGLIQFQSTDWLVTAADLVINGSVIFPDRADYITRVVGIATRRYDIYSGMPYRPMDNEGVTLRIHSKQTA